MRLTIEQAKVRAQAAEIRCMIQDAESSGRYVYMEGAGCRIRIIGARVRMGTLEVRCMSDGAWRELYCGVEGISEQ